MTKHTLGLAEARLWACRKLPYFRKYLMSLTPVERPRLGTACVDKYLRVCYDPDWFASRSIEEGGFVVVHELMHPLNQHWQRCNGFLGEDPTQHQLKLWNMAGDLAINCVLAESGLSPPKDALMPSKVGFKPNLQIEEYYGLLLEKHPEPPEGSGKCSETLQEGDGEPSDQHGQSTEQGQQGSPAGDGEPYNGPPVDRSQGEGGSGSDGKPRPWEPPPPDKSDIPGMNQHEQIMLERQIAKAIEDYALTEDCHSRGNLPGSLRRMARNILHPRVDPARELFAKYKWAIASRPGFGHFTYNRPNRRQPRGGAILPAHVQPVPEVLVLCDASGSMGEKDFGLAFGVVVSCVKTLPHGNVRFCCGDTRLADVRRVSRPEQIELIGGGGTDVGAMLLDAAKQRPRPDGILALTDGETPWPAEPIPNIRIVACLTREPKWADKPPAWIDTVYLHEKE